VAVTDPPITDGAAAGVFCVRWRDRWNGITLVVTT